MHSFCLERAQTIGQMHFLGVFKNSFSVILGQQFTECDPQRSSRCSTTWSLVGLLLVLLCGPSVSGDYVLIFVIKASHHFIGTPSRSSSFLLLIPGEDSGHCRQNRYNWSKIVLISWLDWKGSFLSNMSTLPWLSTFCLYFVISKA